MALFNELLSQIRDDAFGSAVKLGRYTLVKGCHLGNSHSPSKNILASSIIGARVRVLVLFEDIFWGLQVVSGAGCT